MKIDDVAEGKFSHGGTTYQMIEAKINGTVVWPLSYTYLITSAVVNYSAGTKLYAKGGYVFDGNYATVTGDVNVYVNGIYIRTLTGVVLTPTLPQNTRFDLDGNYVLGRNLGTTPYTEHSEQVTVTYGNSSTVVTITQEANVESVASATATGDRHYYGPTDVATSNFWVDFRSDKYTSPSTAAPASGATTEALRATLTLSAGHTEVYTRHYNQDALVVYSYTSGATSEPTTVSNYYTNLTEQSGPTAISDNATITGSAAGFTRSNLVVTVSSELDVEYIEGTSPNQYGRKVTFRATNNNDSNTYQDVTLYQAVNRIESTSSNTTRSWGTAYDTNTQSDYTASLSLNQYNSSSSPAPAGGGTATITISANHKNTKVTHRPYTDTTVYTYTWSSTATSTDSSQTTGETTDTPVVTTITDSPTPTSSQSWATISGSTLTAASRGTTNSSSQRSATISITNGTASASDILYQAKNGYTTSYLYDLYIVIDPNNVHQGFISAAFEGNIAVSAHSYRITRRTYDAYPLDPNARTDSSSNYTAQLSKTNCTSSKSTVYGDETFNIAVTQNTSQTDVKVISLTLSAGTETYTAQKMQDVVPIPTNQVADFIPYIPINGTNKGKVYYTFEIKSGSLTSATITGVYFKYKRNGGSTQSVNLGSMSVSETSSPVLLSNSSIPRFNNDRSVKAWFEVTGSRGGFDAIHANESTYYTYVEFSPYVPPTPDT